jgi:hypothetical protein
VPQSRQSARPFLQSSELGLLTPSSAGECVPLPPLVQGGGHSRLRERGWGIPIPTRGHTLWYSKYEYIRTFLPVLFCLPIKSSRFSNWQKMYKRCHRGQWERLMFLNLKIKLSLQKIPFSLKEIRNAFSQFSEYNTKVMISIIPAFNVRVLYRCRPASGLCERPSS